MIERNVTIATPDGPMEAYLAMPGGAGPHPALIVAQEAFGVNDHLRDVARRFAAEGYVALAPELYHRQGAGISIPYSELPRAREHLRELTNDGITADLEAALAHLRGMAEVAPALSGIVGFCMGGFVAFLAACRTGVASAVVFYGAGIVNPRPGFKIAPLLDEAEKIEAPLQAHFGADDGGIPLSDVEAIRERLEDLFKENEIHVYPGAGHGFFCDVRDSYHAESAAKAWARTLEWLKRTLPREPQQQKPIDFAG